MNLKSNKAITLVALIITIIILLILAGVSLSMVLGDNGLINKAQSSVDKYQQSANNEQDFLNNVENYIKTITVYDVGSIVTINGNDFYVLADNGNYVTLLSETRIGIADNWSDAKIKANEYGISLGGIGRLMTKQEAEDLSVNERKKAGNYWLNDFDKMYNGEEHAWLVSVQGVFFHYNVNAADNNIRPVVEIPKVKLP